MNSGQKCVSQLRINQINCGNGCASSLSVCVKENSRFCPSLAKWTMNLAPLEDAIRRHEALGFVNLTGGKLCVFLLISFLL